MTRKICIITGTRAEYGLLKGVIKDVASAEDCTLQLIATAAHLSPEFGMTIDEIEGDGFTVDERIEILLSSDTAVGVAKAMGLGLIGFADVFARLKPDLLVILGDRFEILAAASAAMVAKIPIAHIHGGEITEGAFDDAIRHSLSKMSHLHFVAAEPYRQRVIQLGEAPDRVFLVGGLGIDAIRRLKLLNREELQSALGLEFGERNLLVTFHPSTLDEDSASEQMNCLLSVLAEMSETTRLIFTMPNADSSSRQVSNLIHDFVAQHANARAFTSLGQLKYLSCLQFMDAVVGNSSSGIAEAPSFGIGTIDIGDRQAGRIKATSVIECHADPVSIKEAFQKLYSPEFRARLPRTVNPYGNGGASEAIVQVLRSQPLKGLLKKKFHDIGHEFLDEGRHRSGA